MKICFIPIDNRPVCYNLAKEILAIDDSIELFIPPREYLGDLDRNANILALFDWLKKSPQVDAIILSLDTIAYGGLIPSRRSEESFEEIKKLVEKLKEILLEKDAKIYAFSSIMRISNNNYNEEEKEYWKDYGKKIFEYSFSGGEINNGIPQEILDDYLTTRRRNFEINKLYLEWEKEGLFETLIFSKDDCAISGFNVLEAMELEKLGAKTKTGADEIPLSLLARAIKKDIKVFVDYTEPECKDLVSNYEDVSIEKSVDGQLELAGFIKVNDLQEADIVLLVNNFREKQGELVMGWGTEIYNKNLILPEKPYVVADVRYANGSDNSFVEKLLPQIRIKNFYGYAGWNTSANTLGSLLAMLKVKFNAKLYNNENFKTFLAVRFLDDWAYQANVRALIDGPTNIKNIIQPFEKQIEKALSNIDDKDFRLSNADYIFPWNRKFEIEICL